ncbi:hypothetical protein [uncultured Sphingomonas sp.]|uniref:hypothetical protein n=1 Tax=uncultured Sphingomonas sp. TaxID=158754 RepID=UPI0025ED6BCB|nr:hypothetical protein [uncultured Sphingomonas sp.]
MIVASRLSAVWQGAFVAAAALLCYLVSQSVATERANVARLDAKIVRARFDIAKLSIELDARTRMGQLERWNNEVLALSAPIPQQFVADGVQLASLEGRGAGHPNLPLNPAVTSQMAPDHVAYTPDSPVRAAEPAPVRVSPSVSVPVPVVQRAVATVAPPPQPLLHQAAYVQPGEDRLGPPQPLPAVTRRGARASSLLPHDIGALVAAENKAGKATRKADAKAGR